MFQIVEGDLLIWRDITQGDEHPFRIEGRIRVAGMIGGMDRHDLLTPVVELKERLTQLKPPQSEEPETLGSLGLTDLENI